LPMHNVISQALGLKIGPTITTQHFVLDKIITYLLCSDGLTNCLSDAQIKKILQTIEPLDECVDELIASANDNGGVDNISVVLLRVNA